MRILLYVVAALFFLASLGSLNSSLLSAAILAAIGATLVWLGNRRKSPKRASKSGAVSTEILAVTAGRLVDIVNESLQIAADSKNADTKLSRLNLAKEKLAELKEMAATNPKIQLKELAHAERDIQRLEAEFRNAGYAEAVEGNMRGQALEKEGKIAEAITEYETLLKAGVDTPFTYQRLAILYKKQKKTDDEIRVLQAAVQNVPSSNSKHYQWFAERLAKRA